MNQGLRLLKCALDWFVTPLQIGLWHDSKCHEDGKIVKWYKGYKKHKAQKVEIKKEIVRAAWHPSRYWD